MSNTQAKGRNIVDLPISSGKKEVSLSVFSFLFSEIVQYTQFRAENTNHLQEKLSSLGYNIGLRILELCSFRSRNHRRDINIIAILQFIHGNVWKTLFGKAANKLEKSTNNINEYYIYDDDPITNKYISLPSNLSGLNCAQFIAGIIQGILDSADFPADVTAATQGNTQKTVYVIQFEPQVLKRQQVAQ